MTSGEPLRAGSRREATMESHFASPARDDEQQLAAQIALISANPVIDGLLGTVSGLLAVLNEHRQILAVNDSLLTMLGIDDVGDALGLRPGEAIGCLHAHETPAGCGTSQSCSSCGAAIALVTSLEDGRPARERCAIKAERGGQELDLYLEVQSHPIAIDGRRFLLLFLQDITTQQRWAAMEQAFFHDISNVLGGLVGSTELLTKVLDGEFQPIAETAHHLALRLAQEVAMQRYLTTLEDTACKPVLRSLDAATIFKELADIFSAHPAAVGKTIEYEDKSGDVAFVSDASLVIRILCNLTKNALEATHGDTPVRITAEPGENVSIRFTVWNDSAIPKAVERRLFQRNFSTKDGLGRGVGLYSAKLFAEKILDGELSYATSEESGTSFAVSL